ncbi:MAG TPA: hypothetical protein VN844_17660 [Pyrinomonadaceae bacterium]|nr:hypothetical protein [Pyrinomonadaceae bacterium]
MAHTKKSKYISFRVTEAQLEEIDMAATDAGLKPREWCRDIVFEKLGYAPAITRSERLLFEHLLRAQYLLTQGFQLLADEKLTGEEWKKLRATAKQRASDLAEAALTNDSEKTNERQ